MIPMLRLRRFRRLRGKMTLTYTLVTAGVFLFLWLTLMGFILSLSAAPAGTVVSRPLFERVAADVAPYLAAEPVDRDGLALYLDLWVSGDTLRIENDDDMISTVYSDLRFVAVVDPAGDILAVEPAALPLGPIAPHIPREINTMRLAVLDRGRGFFGIEGTFAGEVVYYQIVPVFETETEAALGVILIAHGTESVDQSFREELPPVVVVTSGAIFCLTLLVGTFFGWLASRGLVRRLRRLDAAAAAWADGDLAVTVDDRSVDEIGELGRNLNRMAAQLSDLLATETALATVEERNRLARDLHDSAKQQLFAADMQLAAARTLLPADPAGAAARLDEVAALLDQIQSELTNIIAALRPAALQDEGLSQALQAYITDWSRRTGVAAETAVQGARSLPIQVEQALYRVLQEALANVARHAAATQVTVTLRYEPARVTLTVLDDGVGFDPAAVEPGVGLASMRERLRALGGAVTVAAAPGTVAGAPAGGTVVQAVVEVNDDE